MSKTKIVFLILILTVFSLMFNGCDYLFEKMFFGPRQMISGPVNITDEWIEIVPPKPLISSEISHDVAVSTKILNKFSRGGDGETIVFDGTKEVNVEIYLFDDRGERYKLKWFGMGGEDGSLFFTRENPPPDDSQPRKVPYFPTDRTYTKLRLRSDVPIPAEKIEWISMRSK